MTALLTVAIGAIIFTGIEAKAYGYSENLSKAYVTIQSIDGKFAEAWDSKRDFGYVLNKKGLQVGDIVEIQENGQGEVRHQRVISQYEMEKEYRADYNYLAKRKTLVKASVNTTKVNHNLKEKIVTVAIKNHNKYDVGVELIPQRLVKGKWVNTGVSDMALMKSKEKMYIKHWMNFHYSNVKGVYRYKVTTINYDRDGNEYKFATSYTSRIKIK